MKLPDISPAVEGVRSALQRGRHVLVRGPEGSGRSMLARRLRDTLSDTVLVDLPALTEPDAPSAVLLHAASAVGVGDTAADEAGQPTDALCRALQGFGQTLVVRLPGALPWLDAHDADAVHHRARTLTALRALARAPHIVWLVDGGLDLRELGVSEFSSVALQEHVVPFDDADWGRMAEAARSVFDGASDARAVPVVWRLAVGAVHVGGAPAIAAAAVRRPTTEALTMLSDLVVRHATAAELKEAMRAMLLSRRELPATRLFDAIAAPAEWRDFLGKAIGYGELLRINPQVRAVLGGRIGKLGRAKTEEQHFALANANALDDGVADPLALKGGRLAAWVEKVHHYGSSGDAGLTEWAAQVKVWPELYWERARHYSKVRRDFLAAAEIYERCVERFPRDDYAHHYLAWNLEQARIEPAKQRVHYARAVEIAVENPWWNSRRICQLIREGAWIEAKRAWHDAQQSIDPDGTRVVREPWLRGQFHRWVATAWLDVGVWYEARAILEGVSHVRKFRGRPDLIRRVAEASRRERVAFDDWMLGASTEDSAWEPAWAFWRIVDREVEGLPVPVCTIGGDGRQMTWSHPGIILTLEFEEGAETCWVARDRISRTSAHGILPGDGLDAELRSWLQRVRRG